MSSYFKHFPLVDTPTNGLAKNIVARPIINAKERSTVKYSLTQPLRPDQIAAQYYNDDTLDWAIYLANDVVDPYYDFYMDEATLLKVIVSKYGSIEDASQKILFWESNWREDSDPIETTTFNSLPADVKSFYNASTDGRGRVTSYVRKRKTIYKTTNLIVRYAHSGGLDVGVGTDIVLGSFTGKGNVVSVDDEYVTINHVIGDFNVATILGVPVEVVMVAKSISDTEAPYFKPVSAYEAAFAANDLKRHLKLVPSGQAETLRKELKRALA